MYELIQLKDKIDYIIVETTGILLWLLLLHLLLPVVLVVVVLLLLLPFAIAIAVAVTVVVANGPFYIGRADPVFVQVFELDPVLKTHLYIDGIVTLIDAQSIRQPTPTNH